MWGRSRRPRHVPNPGNDFTDTMMAPIDWGGPPSYWQGGAYPSSATNFAAMGGQRFGNIGAFAGMGMDAMLPQFRGMWDVRSAGGYGHMARAAQQQAMIQPVWQRIQEQQQGVADANMMAMGGPGYNQLSGQAQGMLKAMVAQAGGSRFLTPGALSYGGMQQAYGALSNYGNMWTPSQSNLSGFHNAFQNYFYAGGKENLGRTSGLAADDLMAVTAEVTRRGAMRPAMFSEARKSQDAVFGKLALPGEFSGAGITSASVLKDLADVGGDTGDLRNRLIGRLQKSGKKFDKNIEDIVGGFMDKAMGSGGDLGTQQFMGGMESAKKYAQVFQGFKNAGYGGDFGSLLDSLEKQFGDAALNPDRMRAVQQKMAAIVDMTGKSLQQVSNLMTVIQSGPGARLSGERALSIAGIASGVGAGIQGLTRAQQLDLQMKGGNAITSTEKSPRALMEDLLTGSADPRLQALGQQLTGATGKQGRDMVRGMMAAPGQYGVTGALADAFRVMGTGNMQAAATMREMQDEAISRDMAVYNSGGGKDTALRSRLAARGVRFEGNKAVGAPSAADRTQRAGADILGSLGAEAQAALRAAGAAFGLTDAEKQLQLGAALGSLSNLGSQKPALPALQEVYRQITNGQELSEAQALEMGGAGIGALAKLGASVNAGYYQGAVDRSSSMRFYDKAKADELEKRARRTGALNAIGETMMSKDIFSKVFGAEKISGATLEAMKITKDADLVAGLTKIGGLSDKGREAAMLDIAAFNRITEDLNRETDPAARGKLQSSLEDRTKKLAALGISDSFLEKMSGNEGAELMGRIRDASNVGGKEREIKVFVTGVLEDASGKKVGEVKAKQPNATNPENPGKPTS